MKIFQGLFLISTALFLTSCTRVLVGVSTPKIDEPEYKSKSSFSASIGNGIFTLGPIRFIHDITYSQRNGLLANRLIYHEADHTVKTYDFKIQQGMLSYDLTLQLCLFDNQKKGGFYILTGPSFYHAGSNCKAMLVNENPNADNYDYQWSNTLITKNPNTSLAYAWGAGYRAGLLTFEFRYLQDKHQWGVFEFKNMDNQTRQIDVQKPYRVISLMCGMDLGTLFNFLLF
ncbi:hypothetical protein EH221_07415, partial [bacterium]